MANQQDHLMAATGVDVDDAPAPAAPPFFHYRGFWRRAGRRPELVTATQRPYRRPRRIVRRMTPDEIESASRFYEEHP
jgi:hypothetical protein